MSPKGRTELIIGVSGAKFHEETDFDIPRALAPQNPSKKGEKLISQFFKFFRFAFSAFFRAPRVVGGWNFDSREISRSRIFFLGCLGAAQRKKFEKTW